jgi:hypothetical protein
MVCLRTRIGVVVFAALAALPVAARAGTYSDGATGNWGATGTWTEGAAPTAGTDIINIDQYTVTATQSAVAGKTWTGGEIHISGNGKLLFGDSWQGATNTNRFNIYLEGGTLDLGQGSTFKSGTSGLSQLISISGVSTITCGFDGATIGSGTRETQLIGSGTLVKMGSGQLSFEANNAGTTDLSTFSGILDIQEGAVLTDHPYILRNATINLGGASTAIVFHHGQTTTASQPVVKAVTGAGQVVFSNSNYSRDLAIAAGGYMAPGTGTAAGTITHVISGYKTYVGNSNELIFKSDVTSGNSKLKMDVLGATQADADKVEWMDSVGTSTVDFSKGDLEVTLWTPTSDLAQTSWVLVEGDQFGINTANSASNAVPSAITFANVSYIASAGWHDLGITYDYTAGDSKVILTGAYTAVPNPEPGTLGVLAIGGLGLIARRRARKAQEAADFSGRWCCRWP